MKLSYLRPLFEPRDLWVGVYWDKRWIYRPFERDQPAVWVLSIYICLLPVFPLKIVFEWPDDEA